MLSVRTALREHRTDAIICLLLVAATATYLMLRRWPLGSSDEAYYFYHAIRMLDGEVLYRDVFELTTPFLMDLLALAFHLFGETFTTGRAVGSIIQALLTVAIYAGVRAVGAGRALAVAAALLQLAIGQPAWPYTTPHWLAILLVCALLLISLDRQRARTTGWVVMQGLLLGLLLATRQHAGVAVGIGMVLLTLADALNDRLWERAPGLPLIGSVLTLAAATLAGFGLVMGPHLMQAGVGPILSQLVIYPLTGYRDTNQVTWSTNYLLNHEPFTWPALLKYLPLVVAITALRAAVAWVRRYDRRTVETLLVLAIFGASAIAFTMAFPDLTHLAMIMPVLLIVAGELLTSVLGIAGRRGRLAQTALALALIVACTVQLQRNYAGALTQYPIQHYTQFGWLPFGKQSEVAVVEWVKGEVEKSLGGDLLCYPGWSAIYLMTGAHNPTRHGLIFPGYQSEEEIQDVIETLEQKRVEHVLLVRSFIRPDDPVDAYVAQHYRCSGELNLQLCARNDGE
jgi:hypothetical protein|tara:strand:- start:31 stop:1566 length:1536 start_codon:yes stop_codon:yes gene_type:complete